MIGLWPPYCWHLKPHNHHPLLRYLRQSTVAFCHLFPKSSSARSSAPQSRLTGAVLCCAPHSDLSSCLCTATQTTGSLPPFLQIPVSIVLKPSDHPSHKSLLFPPCLVYHSSTQPKYKLRQGRDLLSPLYPQHFEQVWPPTRLLGHSW